MRLASAEDMYYRIAGYLDCSNLTDFIFDHDFDHDFKALNFPKTAKIIRYKKLYGILVFHACNCQLPTQVCIHQCFV